MLVLTRKVGERILVRDDIRIQVLGIEGKRIRIGIEAPEWVEILREEVAGAAVPYGEVSRESRGERDFASFRARQKSR